MKARTEAPSGIGAYLDPAAVPDERPSLEGMAPATRELHASVDRNIRRRATPYLQPDGESVQLDLLGSENMVAWQEEKARATFLGESCWSEFPQTYARYGTESVRKLLQKVKSLERASACVLTDSGMQASAVLFDVLLREGSHALVSKGAYNKTRRYLLWLGERMGVDVSLVNDDARELSSRLTEKSRLVFVETFTNPLTRAIDPERLVAEVRRARSANPSLRLIVDDTVATPWGLRSPLLELGVDFVVASGTKALDGRDRNLWGYIASNHVDVMNECMDLLAMRGGVLDGGRASSILSGLANAKERFERRCRGASRLARFLSCHPQVAEVFHPSLPDHPDRAVLERYYTLSGSLVSFRLAGADDETTRHFCDVLAMTGIFRYALSFDGLVSKVNHHRTVSEYFTSSHDVEALGVDRLVRLGVGVEASEDLIACLNWALGRYRDISSASVRRWQRERARELGVDPASVNPPVMEEGP